MVETVAFSTEETFLPRFSRNPEAIAFRVKNIMAVRVLNDLNVLHIYISMHVVQKKHLFLTISRLVVVSKS